MECELWPQLYRLVMRVGRSGGKGHVRFSDAVIVCVFLWACAHDRPQCWACVRRHWQTTSLKPFALPSASTLSRRLRTESVKRLLQMVEQSLRELVPCAGVRGSLRQLVRAG